jgi:hypothetical protein
MGVSNQKRMRYLQSIDLFDAPEVSDESLFSGWAVSRRPRALRTGLAAGVPFSRATTDSA